MSKEIQTLRPGQIVTLRHDGQLMCGVRVICFNERKGRFEGMVKLTDCAGYIHNAPINFGFADVAGCGSDQVEAIAKAKESE